MTLQIRSTSRRKEVSVTILISDRLRGDDAATRKADTTRLPDAFLWGVATSAFQLEGSPHADWSSWDTILSEKPEVTNHYELYREDLGLLKDLGVNAYRFSLEWSRIQPHEHVWDEKAIAHSMLSPYPEKG